MMPLVSVIIPTFNRAYILPKAIESVLRQTYRRFELLIVDDCSKDETPKIITRYPVKFIRIPTNSGPSRARNRGLVHARGELVAFLDSDDQFLPRKLEKQVKFLLEHPDFPIVQTEEIWYKGEKRLNPKKYHAKAKGFFLDRAVKLCVVSISTVLIRKELFDMVGFFDESFPVCEDYEFWLRVALHYPIGLIEEPLVLKHGGRSDQLSNTRGLDFYRVKALLKILSLYYFRLSEIERLLLLGEALKKTKIFVSGARKHGNLRGIFELMKLWNQFSSTAPCLPILKDVKEILKLP